MTGQEILDRLKLLWEMHCRSNASIYQEPYKGDFFKLFLDAFKNDYFRFSADPRLTGTAIKDYFIDNFLREDSPENDRKLKTLTAIMEMWDEWYYALDKAGAEIQKRDSNLS